MKVVLTKEEYLRIRQPTYPDGAIKRLFHTKAKPNGVELVVSDDKSEFQAVLNDELSDEVIDMLNDAYNDVMKLSNSSIIEKPGLIQTLYKKYKDKVTKIFK